MADVNGFSIIDIVHRLSKTKIEWSPKFAYAIGLIATDGCLCNDGRHIDFTSKDEELVLKFRECLGIKNKIGIKYRGNDKYKKTKCFRVQLGDINFYEFLVSIGLSPKKSKILKDLSVPRQYFWHFLRGCIDGDGSIGSYKHPESAHPQLRVRLYSASPKFLEWIKKEIMTGTDLEGGWIEDSIKKSRIYKLVFAKEDSIKLLKLIYDNPDYCLMRKYQRAERFLI